MLISYHYLFDQQKCATYVNRLHALRDQWIERSGGFYTVGVASYLDSANRSEISYFEELKATNQLLLSEFQELYQIVLAGLANCLQSTVTLTDDFALPGFHIFPATALVPNTSPPGHFDLQFKQLPWKFEWDRDRPISFTLPLQLPDSGGGLDLWDISFDQVQREFRSGGQEAVNILKSTKPFAYAAYTAGVLVLHQGVSMHRIAKRGQVMFDEYRITFQGHGVLRDDEWILYW